MRTQNVQLNMVRYVFSSGFRRQ